MARLQSEPIPAVTVHTLLLCTWHRFLPDDRRAISAPRRWLFQGGRAGTQRAKREERRDGERLAT